MKLPSTIAETGAFQAQGRQVNPAAGRATSGDHRHGFDGVLSNLSAKANGSGSSATSTGKPPTVRQAGATAAASGAPEASAPDAANDAPTLLDALLAGSSRATPEPADSRTRTAAGAESQDDDPMDSVLKRLGRRGDNAPAATPAATNSQDPAALLSLVAPAAAAQANGSRSSAPPESPSASMPAVLPDGADKFASATTQPIGKADAQPLIFDVVVASQLAPADPVSSKGNTGAAPTSPDPAVANSAAKGPSSPTLAGALSSAPAAAATDAARAADLMPDPAQAAADPGLRRAATRPSTSVTPSNVGTAARPVAEANTGRAGALVAGHAQVQDGPSPASSSATASSSSSAGPHSQRDVEADAEPPRKDEAASSLDGTVPASAETLASATPTLSAPVRQVAAALARLAADASASSGAVPATDTATDATKPRPTLARTLTLQMSPAALGTVAVRMHSAGGTLDVQLSASDPQTAGLLVRERDALAASLQDQHTTLHSLVIHDGSGAPQPGGHNATQADTSGAEARAHRQGSDAGSDDNGGQRRERPDGQPRRENASGGDRRNGSQARPSGDRRSLLV